jgi:hypothetical protein
MPAKLAGMVPRRIRDFHRTPDLRWIADLTCGHSMPIVVAVAPYGKPWVETPEGRAARIGTLCDCWRCSYG